MAPPGVGVFFLLAFRKIAEENPHLPVGFGKKPLYEINLLFIDMN